MWISQAMAIWKHQLGTLKTAIDSPVRGYFLYQHVHRDTQRDLKPWTKIASSQVDPQLAERLVGSMLGPPAKMLVEGLLSPFDTTIDGAHSPYPNELRHIVLRWSKQTSDQPLLGTDYPNQIWELQ